MSPVLRHGKVSFAEFEARVLSDWKKEWREVSDWNGDPMPRVYLYASAFELMNWVPLPFEWFSSREAKDALVANIVAMVGVGDCSMVAVCNTVMAARTEEGEEMGDYFPPRITGLMAQYKADNLTELMRFRPDVVFELAAIALFDREVGKAWNAPVKRKKGRPPQLGKWEPAEAYSAGLIYGPIQEALR